MNEGSQSIQTMNKLQLKYLYVFSCDLYGSGQEKGSLLSWPPTLEATIPCCVHTIMGEIKYTNQLFTHAAGGIGY